MHSMKTWIIMICAYLQNDYNVLSAMLNPATGITSANAYHRTFYIRKQYKQLC